MFYGSFECAAQEDLGLPVYAASVLLKSYIRNDESTGLATNLLAAQKFRLAILKSL